MRVQRSAQHRLQVRVLSHVDRRRCCVYVHMQMAPFAFCDDLK